MSRNLFKKKTDHLGLSFCMSNYSVTTVSVRGLGNTPHESKHQSFCQFTFPYLISSIIFSVRRFVLLFQCTTRITNVKQFVVILDDMFRQGGQAFHFEQGRYRRNPNKNPHFHLLRHKFHNSCHAG